MYSPPDEDVYGADFETDNDGTRAWVAQWAISNGTKEFHGRSLDEWKDFLIQLQAQKGMSRCIIYFHNLKYDIQFFLPTLHELAEELLMDLQPTVRRGDPIQVKLMPTECSLHQATLIFRDSAKKMPGKLKALAKSVGLQKLESPRGDFHPGWSEDLDYSEDSDDWTYIDMDARIVAVAMRRLHRLGRRKATASGDAWHHAKESLREGHKMNYKWLEYFPPLPYELDQFFRIGYFGGLNISMHQGHLAGMELTHEDKHNMYGGVMLYDPLPVGLPIQSDKPPEIPGMLYIGHYMIKLRLKDGKFPWFQLKEGYDCQIEGLQPGEPVVDTYEWHEMVLTNVDLDLLQEWYDVEHHPDWTPHYWIFKSKIGVFRKHIEYWTEQKETAKKGSLEYISAKLMINSLYGRFALSPDTEIVRLSYDSEQDIWTWTSEAGVNEDNDAYLPFAMFVTAWARRSLLDNCVAVGCENVIHCDTDSVIHFGPEAPDSAGVVHGDHVGTWGTEGYPLEIYEGGFKRYIEVYHRPIRDLRDIEMAAAGVPQNIDDATGCPVGMWVELLDDPQRICLTGYALGHQDYRIKSKWLRALYEKAGKNPDCVNTMKLIPEKVPGGIILRERTHNLNDNLIFRLRR